MSKSIANVSFRIDSELKNEADSLFESLGLSMTAAFNLFLRQSVREGGIPFKITTQTPNRATRKALKEARKLMASDTKGYPVEEALRLLKE